MLLPAHGTGDVPSAPALGERGTAIGDVAGGVQTRDTSFVGIQGTDQQAGHAEGLRAQVALQAHLPPGNKRAVVFANFHGVEIHAQDRVERAQLHDLPALDPADRNVVVKVNSPGRAMEMRADCRLVWENTSTWESGLISSDFNRAGR